MATDTYFTGKPCKRGHVSERYSASKACVECVKMHRFEQREREKRAAKPKPKPARNPNLKPLTVKTGRTRKYAELIKPPVVRETPETVEQFLARGGSIQQVQNGVTGKREA